jgi:hypothetical protein
MIRTITVTRYVTPLREGGSLPALVEADDDGMYVLKFRAAGHGVLALAAELIAGGLARHLGLPVPEIVLARLDAELARTEPDPEIHALIHDSAGLNVALDYLPGSVNFDPVAHTLPADLASRIVWFDALVSNVDRTPRNTNMLMWHRAPWLIDHGSSLYFHHAPDWELDGRRARAPFAQIKEHVLLPGASCIREEDAALAGALTADAIDAVLETVPADFGIDPAPYRRYLLERLDPPRAFVEEAARAR